MSEYIVTECSYCGELTNCIYIQDPFLRESSMHEDDEEIPFEYWCDDCYEKRGDDV